MATRLLCNGGLADKRDMSSTTCCAPVDRIESACETRPAEACPLCGGDRAAVVCSGVRDFEYGAPGEYQWVACSSCKLVRLTPQPSDEVLGLAYPETYHAYAEPSFRLVRWYVGRRRDERARQLAERLKPGATVLDVGCGTGSLLGSIGRHGSFRLLGVEYRPEAAQAAREKSITVWTGELKDADIPPRSVDLIILEHVIEHVRDPIAMLSRIGGLLKPGGLLVGETPNLDCPDFEAFGRYWGGGHAPRHLFLFTPKVLETALLASGLGQIEISHPVYPAHAALSVQNWVRRNRRDTRGLKRGRAWFFPLACAGLMPYAVVTARCERSGAIRFAAIRPT